MTTIRRLALAGALLLSAGALPGSAAADGQAGCPDGVSFSAPADFGTGTCPWFVVTGDLNLDGKLDLAVVNCFSSGPDGVSVLLNTTPDGALVPAFAGPTNCGRKNVPP